MSGRILIGINRMGELDEKAFQNACMKQYKADVVDQSAAELCSTWQEELKNQPGIDLSLMNRSKYVDFSCIFLFV